MVTCQVFGVCCNNTLPAEIPEEPVSSSQVDEESNALVDEFPLQDAVRRNCGYRSIQPPQDTLYNQSPSSPFLYLQGLAQPYIVNGVEAVPHEFPFMVNNFLLFYYLEILISLTCCIPGGSDESPPTVLWWISHWWTAHPHCGTLRGTVSQTEDKTFHQQQSVFICPVHNLHKSSKLCNLIHSITVIQLELLS